MKPSFALQEHREAIGRIEAQVSDMDGLAFMRNRLVQDAVVRNFEIIANPASASDFEPA